MIMGAQVNSLPCNFVFVDVAIFTIIREVMQYAPIMANLVG